MIGLRLESELDEQLNWLVKKMGKSKSYYVREAIRHYLSSHVEECRRQSLLAGSMDDESDLECDTRGWKR